MMMRKSHGWKGMVCCLLAACSGGAPSDGSSAPPGPAWPGSAIWLDVSLHGACAVASDGRGYCWGSNAEHQLTWPHTTSVEACVNGNDGAWPCVARAPVPVTGDVRFTELAPGYTALLGGIDAAGEAWTYSTYAPATPAPVVFPAGSDGSTCNGFRCADNPLPIKGSVAFASFRWGGNAGDFACGLGKDGKGYCLGSNNLGSLGSGTVGEWVDTPREVAGGHTFTVIEVALGGGQACGLDTGGAFWCWGENNVGQVGSGPAKVVTPVGGGTGKYKQLALSAGYSCALDLNGVAACWGAGAPAGHPAAQDGHAWTSIAAGVGIACGVDASGDGWCWGRNGYGELGSTTGLGSLSNPTPAMVSGGKKWKRIVPANSHTCGIAADDTVWCWGFNDTGQLGAPSQWTGAALMGANSSTPVQVGK
jgi:alpha-tubulin suppressor-like RCC1 family protein